MTPPETIELVGQRFRVAIVPDSHAALASASADHRHVGTTKPAVQEIYVADDLGPDQTRDTLLHEILHGLFAIVGHFDRQRDEERVVAGLTPLLLDCLRRNPDLVAFLAAEP